MQTREERVAESLRIGAEQAAARANGTFVSRATPRSTRQPQRVSVALRTRLQREFGIGCTSCFNATLAQLDKLSIAEIRQRTSEFANSIRENAHEMESVKRRTDGRKLIEWAKANGNGDSATAYERLIIEACDACQPLPKVRAVMSWGEFPQSKQWQDTYERGDQNPDYAQPATWRYKTTADLIEATKKIIPQLPPDIVAVAGVPRSGMIPASVLAAWLHIPLCEINQTRGMVQLGHGSRGRHFKDRDGRLLVIDDTIYCGGAMTNARQLTKAEAIFAATYVRPGKQHLVDVFGEILPSPHLLEWNLLNNGVLTGNVQNKSLKGGWGIDFDGVLCHDCPRGHDGNDTAEGDERYRQWILSAKPKLLSRMISIPMIVTARPERFRADTMNWLTRWGVNVRSLVMHPAESFRERNSSDIPGWKAGVLESSNVCGYIESHDLPAQRIHSMWGKPVISLESGTVYQ